MLALGLRRGEALALRWSDFDRKAKTLNISRNRRKEGSKVVVGDLKTVGSRRLNSSFGISDSGVGRPQKDSNGDWRLSSWP